MRKSTCLLPRLLLLSLIGSTLVAAIAPLSWAQDAGVGSESSSSDGVLPASYQGSGSFFNRKLGTAFRMNYHTEGYGTQDGVVALGAMKVFNMEGATVFLDGQGTLSDDFGGGFNAGVGYRQLMQTGMNYDSTRIFGGGFWVDGQSTSAGNFFTQLGFNLESLGDEYDVRLNGQFPLERNKRGDPVFAGFIDPTFLGNSLVNESTRTTIDTALTVVDAEAAKRIRDLEAWAFIGGYHLGGGGNDAAGYRLGVRGYAVPDVALSLQVTDDDIYHTNVMFGATWFVGRTNSRNGPCGTLLDRFREPVLRNDFIAIAQRQELVTSGDPLTDAVSNENLRFIHVDSNATAGGTGTVEKPFLALAEAEADQTEDDTILVHSDSVLSGNITLLNNVEILGYGNDITHTANTAELGLVTLPEPFPGANAGAVPIINGTGDVFTLADGNRVNNFDLNSGARAVVADGVDSSELGNLEIDGITGDGLTFLDMTGTTIVENSVILNNVGGTGILVDGGFDTTSIGAVVTNSAARSIIVQNRTGGNFTFTGTIADTGTGLLVQDNTLGTVVFTDDLMFDVTGASNGVTLLNNTGTTLNFAGLDIQADDGTGFTATGGGTLAVVSTGANTISTETGLGLEIKDMTIDANNVTFDSVTVANGSGSGIDLDNLDGTGQVIVGDSTGASGSGGSMTTAAAAVRINDATNVSINNIDINNGSTTGAGVVLTSSDAIDMARFSGLNVTTDGGTAFSATGAGTIAATGVNNLTTNTGQALEISDQTIDSTDGVAFDMVNVTAGAGNAIALNELVGGSVTIGSGTNAGDGGTLATAATAITVDDAIDVTINNININNTTAGGLDITNQTAGDQVTSNGMNITTTTADAVSIAGNTSGTVTLDSTTTNSTSGRGIFANANSIQVLNLNNVDVTTTSGAGVTVTNSGTLGSTGTNDVSTITGTGVQVESTNIASGGTTFSSVNVNGATNAVVLTNLTGGRITVGSTDNASSLTTTGDAIVATNVQIGTVSNVDIDSTGGTAVVASNSSVSYELRLQDVDIASTSSAGIDADHTGTGAFLLQISDSSDIDSTVDVNGDGAGSMQLLMSDSTIDTTGTDKAFNLDIGTSVTTANLRIETTNITAVDAAAFDMNVNSNAVSPKTVNFLLDGGTIANNSATTNAEIDSSGDTAFNATITGMMFDNAGAGNDFDIASNDADSMLALHFDNNTANGGAGNFAFHNPAGNALVNFEFQDRGTLEARNNGTFTYDSALNVITDFGDIAGPVPLPP